MRATTEQERERHLARLTNKQAIAELTHRPRLWKKVAVKWDEKSNLLALFLKLHPESEGTRRTYGNALSRFWDAGEVRQEDVARTQQSDITGRLYALRDRGLSPGTIKLSVSVLRTFFRWLTLSGACKENPCKGLKYARLFPKKVEPSLPHIRLQEEHVQRLLDAAAQRGPTRWRDQCLVACCAIYKLSVRGTLSLKFSQLKKPDEEPARDKKWRLVGGGVKQIHLFGFRKVWAPQASDEVLPVSEGFARLLLKTRAEYGGSEGPVIRPFQGRTWAARGITAAAARYIVKQLFRRAFPDDPILRAGTPRLLHQAAERLGSDRRYTFHLD